MEKEGEGRDRKEKRVRTIKSWNKKKKGRRVRERSDWIWGKGEQLESKRRKAVGRK